MSISKEDKQLELLRWLQQCIDNTKQLRFQIPIAVVSIQLLTISFTIKDAPADPIVRSLGLALVILFTVAGSIATGLAQFRYNRLVDSLLYLRKKMGMHTTDFYDLDRGRGPEYDRKENLPGIFILSYAVIALVCVIVILAFFLQH